MPDAQRRRTIDASMAWGAIDDSGGAVKFDIAGRQPQFLEVSRCLLYMGSLASSCLCWAEPHTGRLPCRSSALPKVASVRCWQGPPWGHCVAGLMFPPRSLVKGQAITFCWQ